MADIRCAVCGEPWDAYGVRHGDMKPWEAVLFRAGAGCPACEGTSDRDHTVEHMESLILDDADDDPDSFALTINPEAKRPKWTRPPDVVLWECAGCDSKIVGDVDWAPDSEFYRGWSLRSANRDRYAQRDRHGNHIGRWSDDPEDQFKIEGKNYCPACATTCDDCGKDVFCSNESATDTQLCSDSYDPGMSFADPRDERSTICINCLEAIPTCSYCGEPLGDSVEYEEQTRGACCGPPKADSDEETNE